MAEIIIPALIAWGGKEYSRRQAEKAAEKRQKKQVRAATEMQAKQLEFDTLAGEHWDSLSRDQMVLQSQARQMNTLLDLIKTEGEGGSARQVLTLPPAKAPPAPLDRLNQAIDDLIGGFA